MFSLLDAKTPKKATSSVIKKYVDVSAVKKKRFLPNQQFILPTYKFVLSKGKNLLGGTHNRREEL